MFHVNLALVFCALFMTFLGKVTFFGVSFICYINLSRQLTWSATLARTLQAGSTTSVDWKSSCIPLLLYRRTSWSHSSSVRSLGTDADCDIIGIGYRLLQDMLTSPSTRLAEPEIWEEIKFRRNPFNYYRYFKMQSVHKLSLRNNKCSIYEDRFFFYRKSV